MKKNSQIKINILDVLLLATVAFSISGFILAKAEKTQLNNKIEGKEKISIEVLIPDVYSKDNELFKINDFAALTIRNRPYTKLKIIKTESKPKQLVIPVLNSTSYKTIPDPTRPDTKDYLVTLSDTALKTNDGYVIGGNKIKIGNQVELEGFSYRLNGKVINLYGVKGE